jgi:hypothetical protein
LTIGWIPSFADSHVMALAPILARLVLRKFLCDLTAQQLIR